MVRVLIAGGGVAGLEALLALRDLAGDRVELTLLSPEAEFVYRPMAVAEPFGRGRADRHPLADITADVRAGLIHGELAEVDAPNHVAITGTGQRLSYDALLVAVGDAIAFPVKQGGLASQQADAAAESIAAHAGADVEPRPYRPVLRGMMLTGRGKAWMRHQPAGGGEGTAVRRALWWPPTKIAGRYLSPYLAARHGIDAVDEGPQPDGQPVELDLERDVPATADALRQASLRSKAERTRFAERRAEARREAQTARPEG